MAVQLRVTQIGQEALVTPASTLLATQVGVETLIGPPPGIPLQVLVAWNASYDTDSLAMWAQPYSDLTDATRNRVRACVVHVGAGMPDHGGDYADLEVENDDLRFTSANTGSPIYPYLPIDATAGRPVRICGRVGSALYPLFFGFLVKKTTPLSPRPDARVVRFRAVSPLGRLLPVTCPGAATGFAAADLVGYILDAAAIVPKTGYRVPAAARAIDADPTLIRPSDPPGAVEAVGQQLARVADQAGGAYFVRPVLAASASEPNYRFVYQARATKDAAADDVTYSGAQLEAAVAYEQAGAVV